MEWTALWDNKLAITGDVQDVLQWWTVEDVKTMPALPKKLNQCPDNIPLFLKDWHFNN